MGAPLWRWGGYRKKNEEMTRLLFGSLKTNGRFARGDRTVGLHCVTRGCTWENSHPYVSFLAGIDKKNACTTCSSPSDGRIETE